MRLTRGHVPDDIMSGLLRGGARRRGMTRAFIFLLKVAEIASIWLPGGGIAADEGTASSLACVCGCKVPAGR